MLYGIDEYLRPRRHPLIMLGLAVVAAWVLLRINNPGAPFFSPWHSAAPAAVTGSLSGSFGALGVVSGEGSLIGAPTISVAKIEQVLASYGSPAVGKGQAMYDLGIQYGIDPAYCLAFFIHESTAGTKGVATVTLSIGNIRVTPGYADYQGYRRYNSWEEGIKDWYKLIRELYIEGWQLTTVDQIIPVYAPSSENDTAGYIAVIHRLVATWRAEQ